MTTHEWNATGDGWELTWTPVPPHLRGTPRIVEAVLSRLDREAFVEVTPTGPSVPADPADPIAVLGVLVAVEVPRRWSGDVPAVPALPDGAVG